MCLRVRYFAMKKRRISSHDKQNLLSDVEGGCRRQRPTMGRTAQIGWRAVSTAIQ